MFARLTLVGHPCSSSISSYNVGPSAIFFFFYKPHGRCRCVSAVIYILLYGTYILRKYTYIYVSYYLCCCCVLLRVVSIYSTVRTMPWCLFHTTAPPPMPIGKLARFLEHLRFDDGAGTTLSSCGSSSELAELLSWLSSEVELERSHSSEGTLVLAIAARSQDRKIGCVPCALRFFCARVGEWTRARVCVFMCSYVEPPNIYRDKQSRQWV